MRCLQLFLITFLTFTLCASGQPRSLINKSDTLIFLDMNGGYSTFSFKGKMGLIDSNRKVIVPAMFYEISRVINVDGDFHFRFIYEGKQKGIFDNNNLKVIIPVGVYDDIDYPSNGFFKVKKNGKYSFVNTQGKCIDKWFDKTGNFGLGLAPVKLNGKWGFINENGELVISNTYSEASNFSSFALAPVKLNGKWGYIDLKGNIAIPPTYEEAWPFYNELALVKQNGYYGFINIRQEVAIPFQFKKAFSFHKGQNKAYVKINGKWTFIDKQGNAL